MKHLGPTLRLAQAVTSTRAENLSAEVVGTAKACLLDTLGVALAGCGHPLVRILRDVTCTFGSAAQVTLLGWAAKASVPDAALINGAAAHALDFDDMHIVAAMHPSVPVVPAALAVAEHVGSSGIDVLHAIALGIEAELRIGESVNPAHYEAGWHATATLGRFGAAIAAGTLLGLRADQMVAAIGIAGTQASGLKEVFGTMTKPFHAGVAARDGVMAAFLAASGFTSSEKILEGERGFGKVLSVEPQWSTLTEGWGNHWAFQKVLYKPHAAAFCCQALIEGVIGLRNQNALLDDHVRSIRAAVSRRSVENARVGDPRTGLEAKFSLTHTAAQALAHGQATEADFTDARALDPRLRELRKRVSVSMLEELGWPEAIVEIDLKDGRTVREAVDLRRRSATALDKWRVVEPKFRRVAGAALSDEAAGKLVESVRLLDGAPNLRKLLDLSG